MQRTVDTDHLNQLVIVRLLGILPIRVPQARSTRKRIDVDEDDALGFGGNAHLFAVDFQRQAAVDAVVVLPYHRLPPEERVPDKVLQ